MSLIDVAIPLIAGLILVACPQFLFKKSIIATEEENAQKQDQFRKAGYVLLGVAVIYFIMTFAQP